MPQAAARRIPPRARWDIPSLVGYTAAISYDSLHNSQAAFGQIKPSGEGRFFSWFP